MMSTTDDNEHHDNDTCANCGKEGGNLNTCKRCKVVKYCNAACKKKHRSKHKKKCDRRVAEMHDEKLFKQPPLEDCPICFLTLPSLSTGSKYNSCCGKIICSGCIYAPVYDNNGNKVEKKCPFCRALPPTSGEELIRRTRKRVKIGDAEAINCLGGYYAEALNGLTQDVDKALELWHRAGELGHVHSYYNIGNAYSSGRGVGRDMKKATHYWGLAAMGGYPNARHNLGIFEERAENYDRALKHYMNAVEGGYNNSLKTIKQMYSYGHAAKADYAKALQTYQEYLSEIKSDQRDKAAESSENYKYYV